jgi:hypothetical protein
MDWESDQSGYVSVLANGEESKTFKAGKGLRQGGPLSPLLFNLVIDVLTMKLEKAAENKLIIGLLEQFRVGGIMTLQYADDTVLCSTCDRASLRNLKGVLLLFGVVSGMIINFHKNEGIPMNVDGGEAHEIAHLLSCLIGTLPFKYFGVLRNHDKLRREDIQHVLDKLIKRIDG